MTEPGTPPTPAPGPPGGAALGAAERLVHALSAAVAVAAGVCLTLMMIQTVADVVAKYAFNFPILGNLEVIAYYYMTAVVFLPLAIAELRHEHINVDLAVRRLSLRARNRLFALTALLAAGFFALLAYQTYHDAVASTARGEILMGSAIISVWPAKWFLPIGFALGALACLVNMAKALAAPSTFDPTPDIEDVVTD